MTRDDDTSRHGSGRRDPGGNGSGGNDGPPFAAHRIYYLVLKVAVLVFALALAARLIGLWS